MRKRTGYKLSLVDSWQPLASVPTLPASKNESTCFNNCYAVGDGDRGEASAFIERIVSYARHAIADSDGGEAGAAIERSQLSVSKVIIPLTSQLSALS